MKNKIQEQIEDEIKPFLDYASKERIKERLFTKINAAEAGFVKEISGGVVLSAQRKAVIKERIFNQIEQMQYKRFNFNFLSWTRRFATALTLTVFVFSIFNIMPSKGQVVFAESFTKVGDIYGEVYLERQGVYVPIQEEMQLKEQDRLVTGSDGYIEIEFFDESVSRMSSNGEIVIEKLFRPEESRVRSYVEVSVKSGALWSRVVNLVEKNSAFVVQNDGVYATARKKAAFNVEVVQDEVEVEVFSNVVEVKTPKKLQKVVSGKKAVVQNDEELKLEEIVDEEREVVWVKKNLDNDQVYLDSVGQKYIAEKMEVVGVEEDEVVEIKESKIDKVVLLLTFDDVKKAKKELDIAEKKFIAAELKLANKDLSGEEIEEIEEHMDAFSNEIKEFKDLVKDVGVKDSKYAEELDAYVEEKVLSQKKSLDVSLPADPSYKAKEKIKEVELELASDDPEELEEVKVEQRKEKLAEAEQGVFKGDTKMAMQAIDDYEEDLLEDTLQDEVVDDDEIELKQEIDKSLEMVEKDRGSVDLEVEEVDVEQSLKFGEDLSGVVYELE